MGGIEYYMNDCFNSSSKLCGEDIIKYHGAMLFLALHFRWFPEISEDQELFGRFKSLR